jgi:formylglycine-generating enzyme required for sulfatase activity
VAEAFDPYLQWLGIREPQRPPNHYRLLGIELFESDPDVIATAADRQMAHVRTFQTGRYAEQSQQLLNELAAAKLCLLKPDLKRRYDAELRKAIPAKPAAAAPPRRREAKPSTAAPSKAAAESRKVAAAAPAELAPLGSPAGGSIAQEHARRWQRRPNRWPWVVAGTGASLAAVLVAVLAIQGGRSDGTTDKPPPAVAQGSKGARDQAARPGEPPGGRSADSDNGPRQPAEAPDRGPGDTGGSEPGDESPSTNGRPPRPTPPEPSEAFTQALAAARDALRRRDVAAAATHLQQAAQRAQSPVDVTHLARQRTIYNRVAAFWNWVQQAAGELAPGHLLLIDGQRHRVLAIEGQTITLDAGSGPQSHRLADLPAAALVALAEGASRDTPAEGWAAIAAFLMIDREGDETLAMVYLDRAVRAGVECEELVAELPIDAAAVVTFAASDSPPQWVRQPAADGGQPAVDRDTRLPVPDDARQQTALDAVRQIYGAEFAAAKNAEQRARLAAALIEQAAKTTGDPAARYVLLAEARDLAVAAANLRQTTTAVDALAEAYQLDRYDLWLDALGQLTRAVPVGPALTELVETAMALADEAAAEDAFDAGTKLLAAALSAAQRSRDRELIAEVTSRQKTLRAQQNTFEAAQRARQTLADNPDDPAAHLTVGRFLALERGDWEAALPHLARVADAVIRRAAELDLAAPATATDRIAVGDAWWDAASRPALGQPAQARAAWWYEQALPETAGLEQVRIKKRLQEYQAAQLDLVLAGRRLPRTLAIPFGPGVTGTFRLIPPGTFIMLAGTPNARQVAISKPFYIGVTEVTQAQWQAVMGTNPSYNKAQPDLPVEMVSWDDCQAFVKALNGSPVGRRYRFSLPTEAQWEYACRAGTTTKYFFGDDPDRLSEYAWFRANSQSRTQPVARLKPNPWGLHDMLGNANEWCQDFQGTIPPGPLVDPTGPAVGQTRMARGLHFTADIPDISASRMGLMPTDRYNSLGLRLVLEPRR